MKHSGLVGRVPINRYFVGSQFHHLNFENNTNMGVYIPSSLHRRIYHNTNTGKGIDEINKNAYNWMVNKYKIDINIDTQSPTYEDFITLANLIKEKHPPKDKYKRTRGVVPTKNDGKICLNVIFDPPEGRRLERARAITGLNWNNFVLYKAGIIKKSQIIYNKTNTEKKKVEHLFYVYLKLSDNQGYQLQKAKKHSGKNSWHDFILDLVEKQYPQENK